MKEEGRAVLQEALNLGLDSEVICGKLVVGNRRGLNLATELSGIRQDITSLKRGKIKQDLKIESLEGQVFGLKLISKEYDLLRQRFLSMYKRKVNKSTKKDLIIQTGNAVAHGGGANADAKLYLSSLRRDTEVYREFYGLDTPIVPLLGECFSNH